MVVDHIKYAIPSTSGIITNYFGRISFPLFAFVAVQGYLNTSNFKKYLYRLTIFGIISQIPFMLFISIIPINFELNIMFTLLLGLLSIFSIDKIENKLLSIILSMSFVLLGILIHVDYSWYGVGLVLLIYLTRKNKLIFSISYILYTLFYCFYHYINFKFNLTILILPYIFTTTLPLIFMLLYNGKLGKKLKYFYYWFYPIHLIILYLLSLIQ